MDEKKLEEVAQEVGRLDLADHILAWDRKQGVEAWDEEKHAMVPNPLARRCQADKKHGILQMHSNGVALICTVARPSPCTYSEPVSR